jgi:putative beta-lysine N-acetyltransferase
MAAGRVYRIMKNKWEFDRPNDRIVAYFPAINEAEAAIITNKFFPEEPGKLIIYTSPLYEEKLTNMDFTTEAEMAGFFQGNDAVVMTRYFNKSRAVSKQTEENKQVLKAAGEDTKDLTGFKPEFTVEKVTETDLAELAELFKIVFPVYPTNVFDPDYLKAAMETEYTFFAARDESGKIIGAASAMDSGYGSAEITDCAVLPEYRGKQILPGIILELEKELLRKGIKHVYSITRAKSFGMNMTVKRLGYHYQGTLTNNCIISTGYEDMNMWTKKLG